MSGWVGWGFIDYITRLEDIDEVMEWYNAAVAQIKVWAKERSGKAKGKG